jgi:hypothetical protein
MMFQTGKDPEELEEMRNNSRMEGHKAFEQFVNDKTRFNSKELIIGAYEGVLTHQR